MEELSTYLPLIATALMAGVVNALAGGGTLLTFPALMAAGVSPAFANGTSTVALVPGSLASVWGYRRELSETKRWAWLLSVPSLIGGLVGSLLVTRLPEKYFAQLVPWLILTATILFVLQPILTRLTRTTHNAWPVWLVITVQFLTAVYGGYFGAGIGIIMLATLSFIDVGDIHRMNAVKTVQAVLINIIAAAIFVIDRYVEWRFALMMAIAAIVGGFCGAHYGRKLNRNLVRGIVIGIGISLTVYYFTRT